MHTINGKRRAEVAKGGEQRQRKRRGREVILAVGLCSRFLSKASTIFGNDLCVLSNYRLSCQALSALSVRMLPEFMCVSTACFMFYWSVDLGN